MTPLLDSDVPDLRVHIVNDAAVRGGEYVLYWMIANRRGPWNFSLQRAADWARSLHKPLVVLEALRVGYPWASDRIHWFIMQGMMDNARYFAARPVVYYPYLEPQHGAGRGLLEALAKRACVVVSDDFPCFFLPRMLQAAQRQISVRFELVDSNGLFPMRAADKVFLRAVDFRRFLQQRLPPHLVELPAADPLEESGLSRGAQVSDEIARRWPLADVRQFNISQLADLPIDHQVVPVPAEGGSENAGSRLQRFLSTKLVSYGEMRNKPEEETTTGLSPYLHFGHISAHEIFAATMRQEGWSPTRLSTKANGSAQGWWGTSDAATSFLDQFITWRELGYNMCWQRSDYDQFASLPAWAQKTLADHAHDRRDHVYSLDEFERAATHDPLWNAAQTELRREGRIHNYLRMLWGKKILEWSHTPQEALAVMIELNNKYALDGRNPNSYSGIFWVLGRYDRPWGPERRIFGKIRYMSSENTARKVRVRDYIDKHSSQEQMKLL